jgi:hypothetical protein
MSSERRIEAPTGGSGLLVSSPGLVMGGWHHHRSDSAREREACHIVALAAIGETDPIKLKNFALHATRADFRPRRRPLTRQMPPVQRRL